MATATYTDALLKLPEFIRADLFRMKALYPAHFLDSVAKVAPTVFEGLSPEDADKEWREMKSRFKILTEYAGDFFDQNAQGQVQIPDHVYELFGIICTTKDISGFKAELSNKASDAYDEIQKLKWDPYPRETPYAGADARFLHLVMAFIHSFIHGNYIASNAPPRELSREFLYSFLNPMRTLDPSASALEAAILSRVEAIEMMMDFEHHPYYAQHLNYLRSRARTTIKVGDLLKEYGFEATPENAAAVRLSMSHLLARGQIRAENTLVIAQSSFAQTRLLLDHEPGMKPEFITFSLVFPMIGVPLWEQEGKNLFGPSFDTFNTWCKWMMSGEEPEEKPLSTKTKARLSNIMAAFDIVELEEFSLIFRQNDRKIKPVSYEDTLRDAKAALLRIRSVAQNLPAANAELDEMRREMLAGAFEDLHTLSEFYPVLGQPEDAEPTYDEPSI